MQVRIIYENDLIAESQICGIFFALRPFYEHIIQTLGRRGGPAEDRGHHGRAARVVEEGERAADERRHGLPEETDGEGR